jgi:hypothetical protein
MFDGRTAVLESVRKGDGTIHIESQEIGIKDPRTWLEYRRKGELS